MSNRFPFLLLFLAVSFLWVSGVQAAESVLLGVFGQQPCADNERMVFKPLFVRQADQWRALDDPDLASIYLTKEMQWHLWLRGNDLGTIVSIDPGFDLLPNWYRRDFLLLPTKDIPLIRILNMGKAFAGWCDAPKYRPLVSNTILPEKDPEGWQEAQKLPRLPVSLSKLYARTVGDHTLCRDNQPYQLIDQDIHVVKNLRSESGQHLFAIEPSQAVSECNSELGWAVGVRWFYLDESKLRDIGSNLDLIDFADYDHDGKTEFLFWRSYYNDDGYILFSRHFQNSSVYSWSYH